MSSQRDVLFLVALPASGKSEIRRYLDHGGLDAPVHVDDYPYVHAMRRISEEMVGLGRPGAFFASNDVPFSDRRDWSTLSSLLDEDVRAVLDGGPPLEPSADALLQRLDRVRCGLGLPPVLEASDDVGARLAAAVDDEARRIADDVNAAITAWSEPSTTLVVELARGGAEGMRPPLAAPLGYAHAFSLFAPPVLRRAMVLYVWVTPEESRRRNRERTRPGREGDASILHHGVPEQVMREDYGCDDLMWLLESGVTDGAITVESSVGPIDVPTAVLDNRDDLTSHLRGHPDEWDPASTAELGRRMAAALDRLAAWGQPTEQPSDQS